MTILVAEDDEDDFFFTARAFRKAPDAKLVHVENGRQAIDYLAGRGQFSDRGAFPFPDVLLLDLKMEEVDGHGVLAWIRDHLAPRRLKVFVLTGSGEIRDRELVKASGVAAGYFVKPLVDEHVELVLAADPNHAGRNVGVRHG
jgi:two-component system response regulator